MKKLGWSALAFTLGLTLMGCLQQIPFSSEPAILRGTWQAKLQKFCDSRIESVAWNPQNTGALVFFAQALTVWDSRNNTTRTLETNLRPTRLVWTQDGTQVLGLYPDQGRYDQALLKRYDPATGKTISLLEFEDSKASSYDRWWVSQDGRFVAASTPTTYNTTGGDVHVWDAQTGQRLHTALAPSTGGVQAQTSPVISAPDWVLQDIVWSNGGSRMGIVGSRKGVVQVEVLETTTGAPVRTLLGGTENWKDVRLGDDGTTISLLYQQTSSPENWTVKDVLLSSGQPQREKTFARNFLNREARFAQNGNALWFLDFGESGFSTLHVTDLDGNNKTTFKAPFVGAFGIPGINSPSPNAQLAFTKSTNCLAGMYDMTSNTKTANLVLDTDLTVTGTLELNATFRDSKTYKVAGSANLGSLGSFQVSGVGLLPYWSDGQFVISADATKAMGFDLLLKNATQVIQVGTGLGNLNSKENKTVTYTGSGQFTENNRNSSAILTLSKAIP